MTEAYWGDTSAPAIDWRMSAALENVPRGGSDVAEVTNLEAAVRAWLALDPTRRAEATLTPEHPLQLGTEPAATTLHGAAIQALADILPHTPTAPEPPEAPTAA